MPPGGVLFGATGEPVAYWAHPLDQEMCAALGVEAGEPRHMTTYELAALHISLVVWAKQLSGKRLGVAAELDSESALLIASKLPSSTPAANRLAGEIALDCARMDLDTIWGAHFRGSLNVEADALSRLGEGKKSRVGFKGCLEFQSRRRMSYSDSSLLRVETKGVEKTRGSWGPARRGRRRSFVVVRLVVVVARFRSSFVRRSPAGRSRSCVPQPFRPKCSAPSWRGCGGCILEYSS